MDAGGQLEKSPGTPGPLELTQDQVDALNREQAAHRIHPMTCGHCRDTLGVTNPDGAWNDRVLVATATRWVCATEERKRQQRLMMKVVTGEVSEEQAERLGWRKTREQWLPSKGVDA